MENGSTQFSKEGEQTSECSLATSIRLPQGVFCSLGIPENRAQAKAQAEQEKGMGVWCRTTEGQAAPDQPGRAGSGLSQSSEHQARGPLGPCWLNEAASLGGSENLSCDVRPGMPMVWAWFKSHCLSNLTPLTIGAPEMRKAGACPGGKLVPCFRRQAK